MRTAVCFYFLLVLAACSKPDYNPDRFFSQEADKTTFIRNTMPYYCKLPDAFTVERRFDTVLYEHFARMLPVFKLEAYHVEADTHYFMVSRPAASLHEKRICIAGKLVYAPDSSLAHYEEVFWTFKMKLPQLKEKSNLLFENMVKGKDLSKYYPQNSLEEWIEFPDAKNRYNVKERRWVFGSL